MKHESKRTADSPSHAFGRGWSIAVMVVVILLILFVLQQIAYGPKSVPNPLKFESK